jgi:hypothetical protein
MDERFTVILANAAIWSFRFWYDGSGAKRDFLLTFPFGLWTFWLHLFPLFTYIIPTAATVFAFGAAFLLLHNRHDLAKLRSGKERQDHGALSNSQAMRPLVFPCRTTHTRIFPKKHSFSYSYLLVGIPVGWQGSVGSFLSADLESMPRQTPNPRPAAKPWFTVEAEDHLSRGTHIDGLRGKLEAYLKSEVGS